MTTTYYTLLTRKVKVSGGHDLLKVVPVAHPEATPVSADGKILAPKAFGGTLPQVEAGAQAEILDFALCRKHMETKEAWDALRDAAQEDFAETRWVPAKPGTKPGTKPGVETEEEIPAAPTAKEKAMALLELCASGAVILTALSAAIAFLSLV